MESYASLLRDEIKPAASSRAEDYLERISNAARRLDLLILDALNYSQVLRGECPLAPVDLQSLIDQLIRSYPDFQPPKAEVRVEGELPVVQGTVAGLTQCFSNLLGNAVKFVGPGVQPKVVIYSEPVPAGFRVWIKDNGIGIPAESHERVFNLFQRLDNRYPGTGIGLAIVRKVAEQMQGAAGVESEPDKGSRFWIDLKPATANPISSVSLPAQV
ncbi:MAG TPA: HAMP domain-containing sensor histidine kinase, partial [Verrucomicrobiae bacterium]|nr:HAMP domain-containing sensor histidine kinase [Verrucomicrobiae bacterium]